MECIEFFTFVKNVVRTSNASYEYKMWKSAVISVPPMPTISAGNEKESINFEKKIIKAF